jgi:enoyl-[acyl-carrier protein] reductase I
VTRVLEGSRGLVLGVSGENGVGYQLAKTAIELGATVAIAHRPQRRDVCASLAERLGCARVEIEATDEASFEPAFSQVDAELGRLDFLVHTLVHVPEGALSRPVTSITAAEMRDTIEVGVRSLLVACRHALRLFERSDAPRVVALTSAGAGFAMPNYHVIGIAKAALEAAVRYLALELGPRRILCNAVSFSLIETDAAVRAVGKEAAEATRRHLAKRSPTQKSTTFDDVARTVAYLCSPLAQNLTGEVLNVDGGFSKNYFR